LRSAAGPKAAAVAEPNAPPVIVRAVEVIQAHTVVAFRITFSKNVNAAPLTDLGHYALFDQDKWDAYGPGGVPIASAAYDRAQRTLTLTPSSPVPVAPYVLTGPGAQIESTGFITDAHGRSLVGPGGHAFDVYFSTRGSSRLNSPTTTGRAGIGGGAVGTYARELVRTPSVSLIAGAIASLVDRA
jgi:hypothetical protein